MSLCVGLQIQVPLAIESSAGFQPSDCTVFEFEQQYIRSDEDRAPDRPCTQVLHYC